MDKRTSVTICAFLIIILAIPAISWSGPGVDDRRPPGMSDGGGPYDRRGIERDGKPGGPPSKERMEQIQKRIEMVRNWKLTEALDLDEKTAGRLFPILRKYDRKSIEIKSEMFKSRRQMRQLRSGRAGEKVDAKKLLEDMEKNKARMMAIEEAQYKEIKKILTPEQMVKYIAFEESFRREIRQMLRESRGKGKPGAGGMRGQGPAGPGRGGGGPGMEEEEYPMQRRGR